MSFHSRRAIARCMLLATVTSVACGPSKAGSNVAVQFSAGVHPAPETTDQAQPRLRTLRRWQEPGVSDPHRLRRGPLLRHPRRRDAVLGRPGGESPVHLEL